MTGGGGSDRPVRLVSQREVADRHGAAARVPPVPVALHRPHDLGGRVTVHGGGGAGAGVPDHRFDVDGRPARAGTAPAAADRLVPRRHAGRRVRPAPHPRRHPAPARAGLGRPRPQCHARRPAAVDRLRPHIGHRRAVGCRQPDPYGGRPDARDREAAAVGPRPQPAELPGRPRDRPGRRRPRGHPEHGGGLLGRRGDVQCRADRPRADAADGARGWRHTAGLEIRGRRMAVPPLETVGRGGVRDRPQRHGLRHAPHALPRDGDARVQRPRRRRPPPRRRPWARSSVRRPRVG